MPDDDEYEILPLKQIKELRLEVDQLKKNPLGNTNSAKDLFEAIENLTASVNFLTDILKNAVDQIKEDEVDTAVHIKSNDNVQDKMTQLFSQNESIAKAILALSDKINEQEEKRKVHAMQQRVIQRQPMQQQPTQPRFSGPDLPPFMPFDQGPNDQGPFGIPNSNNPFQFGQAPPGLNGPNMGPPPNFGGPPGNFAGSQGNFGPMPNLPQGPPNITSGPAQPPPPEKKGFLKFI